MAEFMKVPKYVDDAPREYSSFTGGINNDPDNENVYDHELRDAVNTHYRNGNLERRLGALKVKEIEYLDYFNDEHRDLVQGSFILPTQNGTYMVVVRDGFLYYGRFRTNQEKINMVPLDIEVDELVSMKAYDPNNLIVGLKQYEGNRPMFNEVHDGFICDMPERLFDSKHPGSTEGSIPHPKIVMPPRKVLVLQNYRKVEGALFDDKLYIATGTRYLTVEEVVSQTERQLRVKIVSPKETNGFEFKNIGTNLLSPFPQHLIKSTFNLGTSSIENIKIHEQMLFAEEGIITAEAIMNFKSGTTPSDYSFKWEIKRGNGEWTPITSFRNGSGQFKRTIQLDTSTLTDAEEVIMLRCTYSNLFTTKVEEGRIRVEELGAPERLTKITEDVLI